MIRSLISRISGEPNRRAIPDTCRRDHRRAPRVEGLEHRELLSVGIAGIEPLLPYSGPTNPSGGFYQVHTFSVHHG